MVGIGTGPAAVFHQDWGIDGDKDLTIFKIVFSQDPKNNQAIVIKAEGLYQMCRFEHAFALFSKVIELVRRALCNLRLTIIF